MQMREDEPTKGFTVQYSPTKRRTERGVSTVEYVLFVAGIVVFAMASLELAGSALRDGFEDVGATLGTTETTTLLAFDESQDEGQCPPGWNLITAGQTKKNGQSVDRNGDGQICRKDIPGGGNGNTNQNQNVKDNN